jgi:metal-responsive CopG/Arc/MetJ family transcriptional regulator
MPKENLTVSLPPRMRSLVEKEAWRGKRSRSAIVRDALQLYFRLRRDSPRTINGARASCDRRGRRYVVAFDDWRHALGL